MLKKGQDQKGARMLLVEWTNEKWPASYIFNHQDTRPPAAYKRWKQSKSSSTEGQSGWRLTLPPSGTHIPLGRSPHWADEAVQELVRKLSNKALGLDSRAAEEQEELVSRLFGAVKEQTHPLNFVPPPKVRTQVATLGLTWIEGAALVRLDPGWLKRAHWNARGNIPVGIHPTGGFAAVLRSKPSGVGAGGDANEGEDRRRGDNDPGDGH